MSVENLISFMLISLKKNSIFFEFKARLQSKLGYLRPPLGVHVCPSPTHPSMQTQFPLSQRACESHLAHLSTVMSKIITL